MDRVIRADARTIFAWHLGAIGILLACHLTVVVADAMGSGRIFGLRDMFLLTRERNVPSFLSALALLACGGAAALNRLWAASARDARDWLLTALAFTFLAVDEACMVHELFNKLPLRDLQPFHYVWVFPYALAVIVFVAWLLPFLARLPRATRRRLVAGFAVLIGSALGFELVEGALATQFQETAYDHWWMTALNTVEETGELLAAALLLRSLLLNLPDGGAVEFRLTTARRAQAARPSGAKLGEAGPDGL